MTLEPRCSPSIGAILTMAMLTTAPVPALGDMIDTEGMEPWEVCGLCHGHTGLSATARFPRLAGQKAAYLEKQMADFAEGRRENEGGQMRSIITEVAPQDYPAIATWFAGQDAPVPDPAEGDAAAGEALWADGGCAECHGPGAEPHPLRPHIYAQHEGYVAKQLRDFRDGARMNDPDGVMRTRVAALTDPQIDALAAYIATQARP